jgi:hypothetical protein
MVYVRLARNWTDDRGSAHVAGDLVDVDAVTLAVLEADGVVTAAEQAEGGGDEPGRGDEPDGWPGPTGPDPGGDPGIEPASWPGPTKADPDPWPGPTTTPASWPGPTSAPEGEQASV